MLASSVNTMKRSGWVARAMGTSIFTGIGAMMGFYMGSSSAFNAVAREVSKEVFLLKE